MADSFIEFGDRFENQNLDALTVDAARQVYLAVQAHPDFMLVELRSVTDADGYSELLVVDCTNDGVPSKNRVGIKYCERLCLRVWGNPGKLPEVRALRRDFPVTPHQNHVRYGDPASLCLYFEPWPTVERTWTPQKHLRRILWWLAETANESLHREDQSVEQLYFQSRYELALPPDFDVKVNDKTISLVVDQRPLRDKDGRIVICSFVPTADAAKKDNLLLSCISLSLPSIVHGPVERFPASLWHLHDQFAGRGVDLAPILFEEIRRLAHGDGLPKTKKSSTLLILRIPIIRKHGAEPEKHEVRAFVIGASLGELGKAGGVLYDDDQKYWQYVQIGGTVAEALAWRSLAVEPLEVASQFSKRLARQAGGIDTVGPTGVLAGVGALGSAMATLWHREGWGEWTLIDPDYLKPHNLARHPSFEPQVGSYKVDAVKSLERDIYPWEEPAGKAIPDSACNFANPTVADALDSAELIVDATTTLEFPRDLSMRSSIKRAASVFLTPSDLGSAMLMEDAARTFRLDLLEAQYYRSVINQPWGEKHLAGNKSHLWVGAGCRDVSAVIPNELVQVHAATLARQVRIKSEQLDAAIQVWHSDPDMGAVTTDLIVPAERLVQVLGSLRLVWDEGLRTKIRQLRAERLPNETGGVLLGYFDLKLGYVYVVDALSAPSDSQGDPSGFTRGIEGLQDAVQSAQERTGGIVSYIGEWHSHPRSASANPSVADVYLLAHLAKALHIDGLPALMLIIGEYKEQWLIGKAIT